MRRPRMRPDGIKTMAAAMLMLFIVSSVASADEETDSMKSKRPVTMVTADKTNSSGGQLSAAGTDTGTGVDKTMTRGKVANVPRNMQGLLLLQQELQCRQLIAVWAEAPDDDGGAEGLHCPPVWDEITCWNATPAGYLAMQPCPEYYHNFLLDGIVTRQCMSDGTWFVHPHTNRTWTNFTGCLQQQHQQPRKSPDDLDLMKGHVDNLLLTSQIGYSLSLICLLIAVTIMVSIKKLRCPRNILHVNLFTSFILRAVIAILRYFLMPDGVGLAKDVRRSDSGLVSFDEDSSHWECRLFMTLFNYFMTANYAWIFVEGLYLHTLLFVSVFSESSSVRLYIVLGWIGPMLCVLPWAVVRALFENTLCWNTHSTPGLFWIIKGPVMVTIVINSIFFVRIVLALFNKLQAYNTSDVHRYRKLAKSALVLIPLFGVPSVVFLPVNQQYHVIEVVKLYFETTFNSFNGFIVSLLYCFLNGEVQSEISKKWHRYWLVNRYHRGASSAGVESAGRRRMTTTVSTTYVTNNHRGENGLSPVAVHSTIVGAGRLKSASRTGTEGPGNCLPTSAAAVAIGKSGHTPGVSIYDELADDTTMVTSSWPGHVSNGAGFVELSTIKPAIGNGNDVVISSDDDDGVCGSGYRGNAVPLKRLDKRESALATANSPDERERFVP